MSGPFTHPIRIRGSGHGDPEDLPPDMHRRSETWV